MRQDRRLPPPASRLPAVRTVPVPAPAPVPVPVGVAMAVAVSVLLGACSASTGSAGSTPQGAASSAPPPATPSASATPSHSPDSASSWGPTQEEISDARTIVGKMTLAQKAGGVIVASYAGSRPPSDLVKRLHLGGVIVMGDNVGDVRTLRSRTASLQRAVKREYPVLVGVDQEGGLVARVRSPATEFGSLMMLGAARDAGLAKRLGKASGEELRALGFNMVFAPVADVTSGPSDPTIGSRSASSDPALVSRVVEGLLGGYDEAGIVAVVKHFPGHGSVPADSHAELPVQKASLARLQSRDWVPFAAAVAAGAPAVMVGHIDVRSLDPSTPSSLSREVVTGELRQRLGFDGLVVTDALDMAAVAQRFSPAQAAVRALRAGADILLMPADAQRARDGIVAATRSGALSLSRLDSAATRAVALALHQAGAGPQPPAATVGSHRALAREVAAAGITVVSGRCTGRLVGSSVRVLGGTASDRSAFAAAARAAGLEAGGSGRTVLLLSGSRGGSADVVVTLDTPYALGRSSGAVARVALFGRSRAAFDALMAVLTGQARGPGRLPVSVAGLGSARGRC